MRSVFTGAKKCGGAKTHKGRKPDWVLRNLAAVRRRTLTNLLKLQKNYLPLKTLLILLENR